MNRPGLDDDLADSRDKGTDPSSYYIQRINVFIIFTEADEGAQEQTKRKN